ncbi:MAG TPA: 2-hydroxyacid dehydrogenase, partial [Burkholderiaceae bacterium]|nr:2-hydroxyacid dehydrogenase [Burkholderiaceae bacterium]
MPEVDVLAVARVAPAMLERMQGPYRVHERLHESDPAAFAAVAPRVRAIVASGDSRVDAGLLAQLPALQIVSVVGVGYDGIDVAAAKARGVTVTHTPGVLDDDVADLAIGLMLAWARQLVIGDRFVRAGQWAAGPLPLGRKVSGSRLGLVGMGRIGQAIARRAQALDMHIAYTARSARPQLPYRYLPDAAALAGESDFLVVITPGGAATRHLIDAAVPAAPGSPGCPVNVARGSVVDQAALVQALRTGTIAGAAPDVFEGEPQVPQVLRVVYNEVLTPYIG